MYEGNFEGSVHFEKSSDNSKTKEVATHRKRRYIFCLGATLKNKSGMKVGKWADWGTINSLIVYTQIKRLLKTLTVGNLLGLNDFSSNTFESVKQIWQTNA